MLHCRCTFVVAENIALVLLWSSNIETATVTAHVNSEM